jgi:hypothetical protein
MIIYLPVVKSLRVVWLSYFVWSVDLFKADDATERKEELLFIAYCCLDPRNLPTSNGLESKSTLFTACMSLLLSRNWASFSLVT